MKRLFKTIAIALQMGVTYTPAEGDGLFTFNATGTAAFEFGPESPNMTIELYRSVADAEATVSVTSTQMLGKTPVSVLNIPAEATFEAGSHTAHVTITYNENLRADNTYSISLSIPAEQTSLGGNSTIAFNASMAYVWESLGTGQFYDNMCGMIVPVEVLVAANSSIPDSRYRIMNPYPADAVAQIAANVGCAVGGPVSEYIEFVVDPETGSLTWSGYWNCGVLKDPTLSFSHLNYWFGTESPFAGATEFPKECGLVDEIGVYQFKPHVSAFANEEQSSGWAFNNTYEWLGMPGVDLAGWLGL